MENTTVMVNPITQMSKAMSVVCREVEALIYSDKEAPMILILALERNPFYSADQLEEIWEVETNEPVDRQLIERFLGLHHLFGEEWHIVCLGHAIREINDQSRGESETREECELFGDTLDEVRDYWERRLADFNSKRAKEEAAAMAWLRRKGRLSNQQLGANAL